MEPLKTLSILAIALFAGLPAIAAAEPGAPAPGMTAQYNPKELGVDGVRSPRDPASGNQIMAGPGDGAAGPLTATATQSSSTGAGAGGSTASGISETNKILDVVQPNPQAEAGTFREGGVNDTTHRKKAKRNRDGARVRRQNKP